MKQTLPRVLALDLEGTLISSAVSQFPRPGLRSFLAWALGAFERVVVFTSVRAEVARNDPTVTGDRELARAGGAGGDALTGHVRLRAHPASVTSNAPS